MLVPVEAIPIVDTIAKLEQTDPDGARELVRLGLFEALSDLIDEARVDIDLVWKASVADRSAQARRELVRVYVDRRLIDQGVDDVVKAAAGVALVDGYVAKAAALEGSDEHHRRAEQVKDEARDARGRWTRGRHGAEQASYDAMAGLTQRNEGMRSQAESLADQLQGNRYDKLRVVGNALMATDNKHVQAAGAVARVAAEVGPSAQQVLEPGIRRAAYRYRGTEKTPSRDLKLGNRVALNMVQERKVPQEVAPGDFPVGAARYALAQRGLNEEQQELLASADVATGYLLRDGYLPTDKELELSQASGRTPPSIGVMIDRDGDVVSEAQGFNGDHYLPFDLRNLKRLAGGQYVRTRALGGPTSEDIYTGLLTGSRQMRVVSRSGVFTIEFDPDLRGGRRYSDKAKQMVDRYARLVETVASGDLYAEDLSRAEQAAIKDKALRLAQYDEDAARPIEVRLLREARSKAKLGYDEDELRTQARTEADEWAGHQAQAGKQFSEQQVGRMAEQIFHEKAAEARDRARVRQLQLNGEGYKRAMDSLRREFPYFIRNVDWQPLPDFEQSRAMLEPGMKPSPRQAPPAKGAHVARGRVEEKLQAEAYGRMKGRAPAAAAGSSDDESPATGAPVGGPKGGSGGGSGSGSFAELIKDDVFVRHFAAQANVARGLGQAETTFLPEPLADDKGQVPRNGAGAIAAAGDRGFAVWLYSPLNPVTEGRSSKVASYLINDASDDELKALDSALKDAKTFGFAEHPDLKVDQFDDLRKTVEFIRLAKAPFGGGKGTGALYVPDPDNPRPQQFGDVPSGRDQKAYEKFAIQAEGDPYLKDALTWAQGISSPERFANQITDLVDDYTGAIKLAEARKKAAAEGEPLPEEGEFVSGSITGTEAEIIAEQKERSPLYRELEAKQKAWAYRQGLLLHQQYKEITGGESGPKVEKRHRLVMHSPGDPVSRALSKRLARGSMSFSARA